MRPYRLLLAVLALLIAAPAVADTLDMPEEEKAADQELPTRGMAMEAVRARFGEPKEIRPPVGDPPITRWVYDGYTVYFEHRYVINSVRHRNE